MNDLNEFLATYDTGKLLDIACGAGRFTRLLVDGSRSWASIVGLDIKEGARDAFTSEMGSESVTFVASPIAGFLSEPTGAPFDTISIANALHHLEDVGEVLGQLHQLATPKGTLIISEMHADGLTPAQQTQRDLHAFMAELHRAAGEYHRAVFARSEIEAMIEAAGLRVRHQFHDANATAVATETPMMARLEEAIGRAFPDGPPADIEARRDQLLARVEDTGVGTPPQLVYVCTFD